MAAWTAYGVALNPAVVKLYIPPGSNCILSSHNQITWNRDPNTGDGPGINNAIISAYGATADFIDVGGAAFSMDGTHSAKINTVAAGATSVVVNDGNVGRFAVADWIYLTGVCLDNSGGYPPTFQFYEKRQITSISSTTISFVGGLTYGYKSTWPLCTLGNSMGTAGAATIFKAPQNWNTDLQLYGLTVTNVAGAQVNFVERSTYLQDVTISNGSIGPSAVNTFTAVNSNFAVGMEIDKESDTITFTGGSSGQIAVQSSSPANLNLSGVAVSCSINGSPLNMTITNSTVSAGGCDGRIAVGPSGFGHGSTFTITNSTFPVAAQSQEEIDLSEITYSSGTFTLPKSASSAAIQHWFEKMVPNNAGSTFTYKMGYHNSFQNACTPLTTFQVSDIREDGSNYYADTVTWKQSGSGIATPAVLPSLTCASTQMIVLYPAETITQTGTGGSPSLTQFAP